jgi:hypothetical protein
MVIGSTEKAREQSRAGHLTAAWVELGRVFSCEGEEQVRTQTQTQEVDAAPSEGDHDGREKDSGRRKCVGFSKYSTHVYSEASVVDWLQFTSVVIYWLFGGVPMVLALGLIVDMLTCVR